jgi:uncharacterized membrane protein YraQ (UPF0718 family)
MLIRILFGKITGLVAGLLIGMFFVACSSPHARPRPISPEYQQRLNTAQAAKEIQDHNNEVRENNRQIQEQSKLEEQELTRLRAERAAKRNAERAARQEANQQNQ